MEMGLVFAWLFHTISGTLLTFRQNLVNELSCSNVTFIKSSHWRSMSCSFSAKLNEQHIPSAVEMVVLPNNWIVYNTERDYYYGNFTNLFLSYQYNVDLKKKFPPPPPFKAFAAPPPSEGRAPHFENLCTNEQTVLSFSMWEPLEVT